MTKIRLQRTGKRGQPHYRIIVTDDRKKTTAGAIEILGFYNPFTNPTTIKVEQKRVDYWLKTGAVPTDTVRKLLKLNTNI